MLPFVVPGFTLAQVGNDEKSLILSLRSASLDAACPSCGHLSNRRHSNYVRTVGDLPVAMQQVELQIEVRRLRCLNPNCAKVTFAEQQPAFVLPRRRRTNRLHAHLTHIATALGGEAGARLAAYLHMPVSGKMLLHLLRQMPKTPIAPPRVVGIDDWALRKGRTYGTIIVDLEQKRPIDLLPTRDGQAVEAWLAQHPSIEIISRDRSGEYREAATNGAPQAIQVADRWHLLHNLTEAVNRHITRRHKSLEKSLGLLIEETESTVETAYEPLGQQPRYAISKGLAEQQAARRAKREALFAKVKALHASGMYGTDIAREVGLSRQTIGLWIRADHAPLDYRGQIKRECLIDQYVPYLRKRLAEGCTNHSQLWREIKEQGFRGERTLASKWIRQYQQNSNQQKRRIQAIKLPRASQIVWCLLRQEEQHTAEERQLWQVLQQDEMLVTLRKIARAFKEMVSGRLPENWTSWLELALGSEIKEMRNFALGLQKDEAAVYQTLVQPFSNGPVEGQVNRLKFLKRQMYGRAKFDLLKIRVLQQSG